MLRKLLLVLLTVFVSFALTLAFSSWRTFCSLRSSSGSKLRLHLSTIVNFLASPLICIPARMALVGFLSEDRPIPILICWPPPMDDPVSQLVPTNQTSISDWLTWLLPILVVHTTGCSYGRIGLAGSPQNAQSPNPMSVGNIANSLTMPPILFAGLCQPHLYPSLELCYNPNIEHIIPLSERSPSLKTGSQAVPRFPAPAYEQQDARFAAAFDVIQKGIEHRVFPAASIAVTSPAEN